jgi:hypothetical protein
MWSKINVEYEGNLGFGLIHTVGPFLPPQVDGKTVQTNLTPEQINLTVNNHFKV